MSAGIDVRSTLGVMEPGVVGLWRPVLLVPSGIEDDLTPRQLTAVLTHELCHVRRRDNVTAAVHMIAEAMFWFYPPVWWIGSRLVDERERACDEEVLRRCGEPQTYAEGIEDATYHPYMWLWKPHYYSHDYNFYNFPYAFGSLFALGLLASREAERRTRRVASPFAG